MVFTNGSASMKGPSRRRGNGTCSINKLDQALASMKGPSRRRGNPILWAEAGPEACLNEGPLQKEGQCGSSQMRV
ncbi:Hypothetical protein PFR_JS20-2_1838 [Propionibacterium freudenreichii]|nr:Hypothetical protein PFR_JS20-1_1831 [Propionibacterium freudenreichii]SCQ82998.1 Hypothetical protein PFR_JS20-2_1838 [Propionibacterium freudenreichii]